MGHHGKFGLLVVKDTGEWIYNLYGLANDDNGAGTEVGGRYGVTEAQKKRVEKLNQGETRMEHFAIRVSRRHDIASNIHLT